MKKINGFVRKHDKKVFAIDALILLVVALFIAITETPAPVRGIKVESTYSSAVLTWQKSEDADGYRIFRSTDGRNFEYIESTTDNSYTDENIKTGETYYYAVAARNGVKRNKMTHTSAVKVTPTLETPRVSVDTSSGSVELSISEVKGATDYEIMRDGVTIAQSKDNVFVDETAEADVPYRYVVKAKRVTDETISSKPSNSIGAELHQIPGFEIEATGSDLSLEWDSNDYYNNYAIYEGDNLIGETEDTSFTLSDYDMDKIYDISLVGTNTEKNAKSPKIEKRFRIEEAPLDNEAARQAACDWAVMIANDDSFSYGAAPAAWHCGCYFCGTNTRKKGKGYEKTYCCNPFVHAAYAHGAGDPGMLKTCQKGGAAGMKESDYTTYGNWSNVGKPSMGDLEMGDVLIAPSHVMLYIGDGEIVHAAHSGWGPETITTDSCSSFYGIVKFVMRYSGTGSGTMHTVVELDDNGNPVETESQEQNT